MRKQKPQRECNSRSQLWNSKMPPPLTKTVGAPAKQQQSNKTGNKWNRSDPTDALNGPSGESLQYGRQKKPDRVTSGIGKEKPYGEYQYGWMPKRLPNRHV